MNSLFAPSAALAAATPLLDTSSALIAAARLLLPDLERGRAIDAKTLRAAMMAGFGGSDTDGVWDWKTAYEACEAAQVLFLRKFGPAMRARANAPAALLAVLAKIAASVAHRRSEESQALQILDPARARPGGERGRGNHAHGSGAGAFGRNRSSCDLCRTGRRSFGLNELAATRAGLLGQLFQNFSVTRYDPAHIHDHLDAAVHPSLVLMNHPFLAAAQPRYRPTPPFRAVRIDTS